MKKGKIRGVQSLNSEPLHLTREEIKDFFHSRFNFKYDADKGSWVDPRPGGAKLTNKIHKKNGFYFFKVPTSISIGIKPLSLPAEAQETLKGKKFVPVVVTNPAESRKQTEKIEEDKFLCVVLRGGNVHGWSTSKSRIDDYPTSVYKVSVEPPVIVNRQNLRSEIQKFAIELAKHQSDNDACFNRKHLEQLLDIANGNRVKLGIVSSALMEVMKALETSEFHAVGRLLGGGAWRVVTTFKFIRDHFAAMKNHMGAFTVDEMWGGNRRLYSKASEKSLIGFELRADGTEYYVNISLKDISEGATYFMPM